MPTCAFTLRTNDSVVWGIRLTIWQLISVTVVCEWCYIYMRWSVVCCPCTCHDLPVCLPALSCLSWTWPSQVGLYHRLSLQRHVPCQADVSIFITTLSLYRPSAVCYHGHTRSPRANVTTLGLRMTAVTEDLPVPVAVRDSTVEGSNAVSLHSRATFTTAWTPLWSKNFGNNVTKFVHVVRREAGRKIWVFFFFFGGGGYTIKIWYYSAAHWHTLNVMQAISPFYDFCCFWCVSPWMPPLTSV